MTLFFKRESWTRLIFYVIQSTVHWDVYFNLNPSINYYLWLKNLLLSSSQLSVLSTPSLLFRTIHWYTVIIWKTFTRSWIWSPSNKKSERRGYRDGNKQIRTNALRDEINRDRLQIDSNSDRIRAKGSQWPGQNLWASFAWRFLSIPRCHPELLSILQHVPHHSRQHFAAMATATVP